MGTEILQEHPVSGQRGHQGRVWSVQKDRRALAPGMWGGVPLLEPASGPGDTPGKGHTKGTPRGRNGYPGEEAQEKGGIPEKEGKPLGRETMGK